MLSFANSCDLFLCDCQVAGGNRLKLIWLLDKLFAQPSPDAIREGALLQRVFNAHRNIPSKIGIAHFDFMVTLKSVKAQGDPQSYI